MVKDGDPPLTMPLIKVQGLQDPQGPEEPPRTGPTYIHSPADRQVQKKNLPKTFQHAP